MKKKDYILIFTLFILAILISSLVSVAATGNLFDSNEVVYDNTNSNMESSNVKNAVDELYAAANDYSDINNRVTSLETKYGDKFRNNATGYFSGENIMLSQPSTSTATNGTGMYMSYHGDTRGWLYATNAGLVLSADLPNAAGTGAVGISAGAIDIGRTNISTVNLKGTVKINGTEVHTPITNSIDTTIDLVANTWKFKHVANISVPSGKHVYGTNVRINDTVVTITACVADTFGEGQIFVGCYSTANKSETKITVDYLIY